MKQQLISECIEFFTSTHKSNFYSKLFDVIYLSNFQDFKNIHLLSLDLKDILGMLFLELLLS